MHDVRKRAPAATALASAVASAGAGRPRPLQPAARRCLRNHRPKPKLPRAARGELALPSLGSRSCRRRAERHGLAGGLQRQPGEGRSVATKSKYGGGKYEKQAAGGGAVGCDWPPHLPKPNPTMTGPIRPKPTATTTATRTGPILSKPPATTAREDTRTTKPPLSSNSSTHRPCSCAPSRPQVPTLP